MLSQSLKYSLTTVAHQLPLYDVTGSAVTSPELGVGIDHGVHFSKSA